MATRGTAGLKRIAWVLDDLVRIPGTNIRIGLDPLLGLLPGGGDAAGAALSVYTILAASRAGAPPAVILRMAGNIAIDALLGVVPLLGDIFDFGWKANRRNVALLERYLQQPQPVKQQSRLLVAAVIAGVLVLIVAMAMLSITVVRWVVGAL